MKVLQLIDSLQPGGAERMAVSLANELYNHEFESYLCASRSEGLLKNSLLNEVGYLYLKKRNTLDLIAIRKLHRYIKSNQIEVLHAHSSSFFWATIVKRLNPKLRLIWHDHYGDSENLDRRKFGVLRFCSWYFDGIISVNEILRDWAIQKLRSKNVQFVRNFVTLNTQSQSAVALSGDPDYRIVCLANLRPQKDHLNLLMAFKEVREQYAKASLHLIGKEIDMDYLGQLKHFVDEHSLREVHFYGAQKDVQSLLKQAKVGVLSSKSEGLPLALLEYGTAGLPVVVTDVGQCRVVVNDMGKVVPTGDSEALAEDIKFYLENTAQAQLDSERFQDHIKTNYSFKAILPQLMKVYST
jgi:glycosyltransferase involved in cell wall biosynthesis